MARFSKFVAPNLEDHAPSYMDSENPRINVQAVDYYEVDGEPVFTNSEHEVIEISFDRNARGGVVHFGLDYDINDNKVLNAYELGENGEIISLEPDDGRAWLEGMIDLSEIQAAWEELVINWMPPSTRAIDDFDLDKNREFGAPQTSLKQPKKSLLEIVNETIRAYDYELAQVGKGFVLMQNDEPMFLTSVSVEDATPLTALALSIRSAYTTHIGSEHPAFYNMAEDLRKVAYSYEVIGPLPRSVSKAELAEIENPTILVGNHICSYTKEPDGNYTANVFRIGDDANIASVGRVGYTTPTTAMTAFEETAARISSISANDDIILLYPGSAPDTNWKDFADQFSDNAVDVEQLLVDAYDLRNQQLESEAAYLETEVKDRVHPVKKHDELDATPSALSQIAHAASVAAVMSSVPVAGQPLSEIARPEIDART